MKRSVILVLALILAAAAHAKTGVVFIHGKGGADLANPSVARAYWGEDMIRATTKGFAIPYLICSYDGTQYMWVAGGTVAGQIYNWMNANAIDDIVIETHSFGGVVIRWILSNPTYDSRYQPVINRIRWVNSIAPPNKGSEAANLAGTLSGSWLTGWLVDLVVQLRVRTSRAAEDDLQHRRHGVVERRDPFGRLRTRDAVGNRRHAGRRRRDGLSVQRASGRRRMVHHARQSSSQPPQRLSHDRQFAGD